jgi:hypothetical protein
MSDPDPTIGFLHAEQPNSDPVIIRTHAIHDDDKPKGTLAPIPPEVPTGKELAQLMADMIEAEAEHLKELTVLRAQTEVSWLATERWSRARDIYRRMERLYSGTKAREKNGSDAK